MRRGLGLAAFSGFLLTLAFPRWNLWPLAWGGLVPLLQAVERSRSRKEAFLFGFTAGFTFYLLSLSWLRHVTVFGLFFVVTMLAVYWGLFGVILRRGGFLFLSSAWVILEWIRTEIPVWGFGWNLLGYSQSPNLLVAQLASVGGVYAVSFLVVLGNVVFYSLIRTGVRKELWSGILFSLLMSAVLLFGWSRIQTLKPRSFARISVLQGNIPQLLKWEPKYKQEILKVYLNLTELASYDAPALIVWPEAAYPGFFNRDLDNEPVKALAQKIRIPLLVGSPHQEDYGYFNSAYLLLPPAARIAERYDKIRLVPFGEYVPWKRILGFLEPYAYALGVSDFSAGKEWTLFRWKEEGPVFGVLICFEDIFPDLARQFANRGADFLAVITNDAWFGHSSAAYQHVQASVFRAIENGISMIRAANTGVSCFISARGEIVERVRNQEGKDTFVMGGMTYSVALGNEKTIYRRYGWAFPFSCLAYFFVWTVVCLLRIPKKSEVAHAS